MGNIVSMGFALWVDGDLAWAKGTHEYRPMGVAVVSSTSVVQARDFVPKRKAPRADASSYIGLFASLGEVNAFLQNRSLNERQRSERRRSKFAACPSRAIISD